MKKTNDTKKLKLATETLRTMTLSSEQLADVAGGYQGTSGVRTGGFWLQSGSLTPMLSMTSLGR